MHQYSGKCRFMVATIVHNPTANDWVEHFGQIIDAFVDTTVEFAVSHCLKDGFRGSIAHARTEVDEGLTPAVHRQSRPKSVAEKVELLVRVLPRRALSLQYTICVLSGCNASPHSAKRRSSSACNLRA